MGVQTCDQLGHHHAFMAGFVRKPRRTGDVADGIKAFNARAAMGVGHNMRAVNLHTERFQTQPLHITDDADGRNDGVELLLLDLAANFDMGGDFAFGAVKLLDHGFLHDLHALLHEGLLGEGRDLGVLHGKHAVHNLNNGGICTQGVEETRKFDANRARPNDQKLLRHTRRVQGMLVGPNQITIGFQPGQFAGTGAGSQNDVLRSQFFGAFLGLDRDLALGGDRCLAHHDSDLVLLHQVANAARQLRSHAARAFHDGGQIIVDATCRQTEFFCAVHQVEHLCRAQQCLGRDTAPVQADAAEMLAFDDGHLLAQLSGPNGCNITARPCANHDCIITLSCHRWLLLIKIVWH